METVHDREVSARVLERLDGLHPDSGRRWGRMSPGEVLFHLNAQLRVALGELDAEPVGDPAFWHTTGKAIALSDEPWPPGAPTSREALPTGAVVFTEERAGFRWLLDRFAAADLEAEWPDHPRLGPLTGLEWSRFTRNHIDHHFRQFGV